MGPFIVTNVFSHGSMEIRSMKIRKEQKVNGHRLKHYFEICQEHDVEELELSEPVYED